MPHELTSVIVRLYLTGYAILALILFCYGMHAYVVSALYLRVRRRSPVAPSAGFLPPVTVQLPIYNELYVVDRLLTAACSLRYPRERLEIQVLDDSTDETSERVTELCRRLRAEGHHIVHRRRDDRRGFKGGALREGLAATRSEFVAVFDADFVPAPDFLLRAMPHFEDPAIGMVQSRWGHLNPDYSSLTHAQAMALDGHFVIEQTVRNRLGVFINFNGTAGIWRRQAIIDAGNWQDDTLTEDLDLSYRAQLAGWRFRFLPDLICPAELPAEINSFKGQQFRWAKGSMQTARKLLPRLWREPLSVRIKTQATLHLTNHAVYPLLLALALSTLPSLWILHQVPESKLFFRALTILIIGSFGHPLMYGLAQAGSGRRWYRKASTALMIVAGGMGIALNNTKAILEALRGRTSPFLRTPKYRLESSRDHWHHKRYQVRCSNLAFLELAFGLYILITISYAIATQSFLVVPFLTLYLAGFLYTGILSILHERRSHIAAD